LLLLVIYIYNMQDACSLPGLLEMAFVRKGQCQFTTTTGRRPLVPEYPPRIFQSKTGQRLAHETRPFSSSQHLQLSARNQKHWLPAGANAASFFFFVPTMSSKLQANASLPGKAKSLLVFWYFLSLSLSLSLSATQQSLHHPVKGWQLCCEG
jgi:hypothetical protein